MRTFLNSLLLLTFFVPAFLFSQTEFSGTVTDEANIPLPGVNVIIKGTTIGASTDFDGNYTLKANNGDVIVYSFLGFTTQEITYTGQKSINVILVQDAAQLDEVVVIGYGQTTVKDATGSLDRIDSDEFNRGAIVSPENLLAGKSAGVRITSSSGSPGSGAEIRIRNGGSLSANNNPLIVVDGIPLSGGSLNAINPNEIESYTVLKDASATAIYGSRATAGVVIITTKKGKSKAPLSVEYNAQYSLGTLSDKIDVLSADQFRKFVIDQGGDESLLGNAKTDWQDAIYENAFGTIQDLTLTKGFENGSIRANYNVSAQPGILKTSKYARNALNINFEHRFFEDHLKVNVTEKGSLVDNRFADEGAIGSALFFDPTQPITGRWAGFFEFEDVDGTTRNLAPRNPLSLLELRDNRQRAKRNISNLQLDYKFHFLPELRINVNAGFDYEEYDGRYFTIEDAGFNNVNPNQIPQEGTYTGINKNKLLDFYLNYKKDFESIITNVDVTAGHSYQRFYNQSKSINRDTSTGIFNTPIAIPFELILESYFARANFTINKKYIFTGTYRRDTSSRFSKDNRDANFPSAAFSWLTSDEDFLKDSKVISNLKLRLSWGVTGQQDVGGAFPYLGLYSYGDNKSQYLFGSGYVSTIRPEGYNEGLKWEEATMYNAGIDYGLFDGVISGTLDFYYRKNKDLLQYTAVPAGSNLENFLDQNVGETVSKGIEIGINATPFKGKDFNWDVSGNFTLSEVEVTKLTLTDDPNYPGTPTGPTLSGGVGNLIQINSLGSEPNSFYVFKQVVDVNGKPLEGVYVDLNGDNIINDSDKYKYQSPTPAAFFGFTSNMNYKNFNFNFTLRGSLGNYMYNNFRAANGYSEALMNQVGNLHYGNGSIDVLNTGFLTNQQFSDLYVENASFMKLDNISLSYLIPFEKIKLRASFTAQNVFTITNYSGLDPEISSGVDNNIYPKPRTFVLGLNFNF